MTVTHSTALITDATTVATTPPTEATRLSALAPPDLDYIGTLNSAIAALAQAGQLLAAVAAATDAADPNTARIALIRASLT